MEDMLRACVLTYGKDWEQSLPYADFSYNNSYQASLGMSPFEVLYGRKCRTVDSQIWHLPRPTGLTGLVCTVRVELCFFVESPHVILPVKGYVFPVI